jgi:hypothetical protein
MSKGIRLILAYRGAVLSQLPEEAVITSTVAPRHYGVSANEDYNQYEDAGQRPSYDASLGKSRVKKVS